MDDNIPYRCSFSVSEITKLFRMQNTLVTMMITIAIPAMEYNIFRLSSENNII